MRQKHFIVIISILLISTAIFFWPQIINLYKNFSSQLPQIEKNITEQINELKINPEIFTPPPLRISQKEPQSFLTLAGVIKYTNLARAENGLPALKENTKLDASAEIKTKDMFTNQYFAHQSPINIGVSDLAKTVGYNFIAIGENLALGNFKDDQALVEAWMNSQGHRENILNPKYQEIGISVIKGTYEGETTWMAVQHFGMPLSACPEVSQSLKTSIDSNQTILKEMITQINSLESQLAQGRGQKNREENKIILEDYKNLVEQYNNLVKENQNLIDQYNQEVQLFNSCLSN